MNRPADISDSRVTINEKRIRRFFCYSIASSALNKKQYQVDYDDENVHAHIYSPDECNLESVDPPTDLFMRSDFKNGHFPFIRDTNWKFCCSLLLCSKTSYENLMTNLWVEPVYDDPRVAHVYGGISEHMLSTDIMESCDKSLEITKWMEKFMIHLSFADLLKFPGGLMCIICQVTEYCLESDDLSCHDYACKILKELDKLNEKEMLSENDDDANFYVASMNIVASTKFNSEFDLDSRDIIYTLAQGSPLESVI